MNVVCGSRSMDSCSVSSSSCSSSRSICLSLVLVEIVVVFENWYH
jgi:hypothetical protein